MTNLAVICGAALILGVLLEGFETIILPRRVTRRFRLTRFFYRYSWLAWSAVVRFLLRGRRRESWLSFFGPLSLILLLTVWAGGLILGFALFHWAAGSAVGKAEGISGFFTDLYMSGTTFFTLGIGDVIPGTPLGRALTAVEAGVGFAFLALIIGYYPAINQSFSRREVAISLLDARAGSPPTAAEMLRRHSSDPRHESLGQLLHEWERWSAELLESHLSYPVLAYFRSQHDNQSWLAALTVILDTCALIIAGLEGACERQAELTFAMARHAVADLSLVFVTPPREPRKDRLPPDTLAELRAFLASVGLKLREGDEVADKLARLRRIYEPYLYALAHYMNLSIPPWMPTTDRIDNWQATAWERRRAGMRIGPAVGKGEHF